MSDFRDYIEMPQALGSIEQRSLTNPEEVIFNLSPTPPDRSMAFNTQCFCFFDRQWLKQTIETLESTQWRRSQSWKSLGLTLMEHASLGFVFLTHLPWGAPASTCRLEEIQALGIKHFLVLGIAGRLQPEHHAGSVFLIDQAIRDEGTSLHYAEKSVFAHANFEYTSKIQNQLNAYKISFHSGLSWTTDAPYRETLEKYMYWRKKLCLSVEMELSALFCLSKFRKFKIAALLVGADSLTEDGWQRTFKNTNISKSKRIISQFLSSIACQTL